MTLFTQEQRAALIANGLASTLDEDSFPGVFDYEVSESLGVWLRLWNCDGPSHDCIRLKASELINAFFLQSSSA